MTPRTFEELEKHLGIFDTSRTSVQTWPFNRLRATLRFAWNCAYKAGKDSVGAHQVTMACLAAGKLQHAEDVLDLAENTRRRKRKASR